MKRITAICLMVLSCAALAESRMWTNKDGKTVVADFITMNEEGITVRLQNGKSAVMKRETLADGEWEAAEKLLATIADPTNKDGTKLEDPTKPWFTARTASMARDEEKTWETSWGSYNATIDQSRVVEVSVRSRSDSETPKPLVIEVLWLTNGPSGKGTPTGVRSVSRVELDLKARAVLTRKIPMSFSRDKDKYVALGVTFESGGGYAGWVARLVDPVNNAVISQMASREPFVVWSDKVPVLGKK